jgi:anthranilate phosphoribosyltransferase
VGEAAGSREAPAPSRSSETPAGPEPIRSELTLESVGGWPGLLSRLFRREDLSAEEAAAALSSVLAGEATSAQIAAFAAALRTKGETASEMIGMVRAMRRYAVGLPIAGELVDTCGTGGDRSGTINVSTIAALVVAAAGGRVCKHGNRAQSSLAGSADVLEALGVVVGLGPSGVARCVNEAGIGFCLAPRFHPAMRQAAPVRRELGAPTTFNLLGPLSNPAGATRQLVGIGDPAMAGPMMSALEAGGATHAMVVFGQDGLDELSTVTTSTVLESVSTGDGRHRRREFDVDPASLGIEPSSLAELRGGAAADNAVLARAVLRGERGPRADFVRLNAAAALVVAGISVDLPAGLELAGDVLASGAAGTTLERLVQVSRLAAAEEASTGP